MYHCLFQETTLPTLLADPPVNLIAQSQSGTGKTAAFTLAMLSRVDASKSWPQVLCLSPTYELAIQTGEVACRMGTFCPEILLRYAVRGEEGVAFINPNNNFYLYLLKFCCTVIYTKYLYLKINDY